MTNYVWQLGIDWHAIQTGGVDYTETDHPGAEHAQETCVAKGE
jgi:hypothetical protein